ncbi:MAG: nitrous oxide reductase accessory protein NosL [Ferruginibacter sp.]|nr:nitrous oxide reductase accessory protein NosL [Ferruginibacter sp.]
MKQNKITGISRSLLILSGLALLVILFVPMWRIDLVAPQYPEGLSLYIYANKLGGNVDIINGLNHYIGMKVLRDEDFVEFKVLPGIIIFFSIAFVLVGLIGRRRWLNVLFITFVLFGIIAMIDFWRWEYDYGHNLDPNAAIKVPGMSYQPPLIGYKQLLNFEAYSIPATGGWIFIGAGALALLCLMIEWRKNKKMKQPVAVSMAAMCFLISSCNAGPEPIAYGKDACYSCKMTISDSRYGAEMLTKKGRVYKFDDSRCLISFVESNEVPKENIQELYLASFTAPPELIPVKAAFLLKSEQLSSPMRGNVAAFKTREALEEVQKEMKGDVVQWEDVLK